jgi:hypothetical protein
VFPSSTATSFCGGTGITASNMLVCLPGGTGGGGPAPRDADGNGCNWVNCGYNTSGVGPNAFLGGCAVTNSVVTTNVTAGILCCCR